MCFCIEARARGWLWIGPASTDGFVPRMQSRQLEAVFQKAPHIGASADKKLEGNIIISWKFPARKYDDVWALLQTNHIECVPRSPVIDGFFDVFPPPGNLGPNFKPRYLEQVHVKEGQSILPFQSEGIKFGIARQGRFLLGDEPGCGKTLQALGIAHEFREDWPVLVIVPSSLRSVWKLQIELWGRNVIERHEVQIIYEGKISISPNAKFVITSYELANLQSDKFMNHNFKFLICDEAHKIKNSQAQRTQTVTDLAKRAKRIILMTGTPIVNLATDVYQLLKILAGPKDNFPSQSAFEERYFLKRERAFGKLQCSDPCREHELHAILESTVMIRRLKRDVLSQMPEKFRSPIDLDLALVQELKEYREITLQGEYDALKQSDLQRLFHAACSIKKEASATYVAEVLDCSHEEKYLVFAHHVEMLDTLVKVVSQVVSKQGGSLIRICGKTPQRERGELVNKFQTDPKCRVAILGITACAEGITLTAASNIIFAELHWTPAIMNQCEGRAHRMGQKKNVHIQYLLTPGTDSVDHKAYRALTEKQRHCDRAIDGLEETRQNDAFPLYMKHKPTVLDNLEMSKKHQLFPKRLCRPGGRAGVESSAPKPHAPHACSASSSSTAPAPEHVPQRPVHVKPGPLSHDRAPMRGSPRPHGPPLSDKDSTTSKGAIPGNGVTARNGTNVYLTKSDQDRKEKGGTTGAGRRQWLPVPPRQSSVPSTAASSSPSKSPIPLPSPSRSLSSAVSSSASAATRWTGPPTASAAARWTGPPTASASSSASARPTTLRTSLTSTSAPRLAALRPQPSDKANATTGTRPSLSKAPAVKSQTFKPNLLAGRRIVDVTPVPLAQPTSGASATLATTATTVTNSGDASSNLTKAVPSRNVVDTLPNPTNIAPTTKVTGAPLNSIHVASGTKAEDACRDPTNGVRSARLSDASRSHTSGPSGATSHTPASKVPPLAVPLNTQVHKRSTSVVIDSVDLISDDETALPPPSSKALSATRGTTRTPQDEPSTASTPIPARNHTNATHRDGAQSHNADSAATHGQVPSLSEDTAAECPSVAVTSDGLPIRGGHCGGPVYTLGSHKRPRSDDSAPKQNECSLAKKNRVAIQRARLDCLAKELPEVGFNRGKQASRTVLRSNGPGSNLKNARGAFGLHVDAGRLADAEGVNSRGVR